MTRSDRPESIRRIPQSRSCSVSIVIPTHNRAAALVETVQSLAAVRVPESVDCEVLVVANGCTDDTAERVRGLAASHPLPIRCLEQAEGNLNLARNCGVDEATGEMIAFLDDDVTVDPAWLAALIEAFESRGLDLAAGRVLLAWDGPEPHVIGASVRGLLSEFDLGDAPLELASPKLVGANFAVRRTLATRFRFRADLDRAGGFLLSGGDTEFAGRAMSEGGARLEYIPRMRVQHRIPSSRLDVAYLSRLAYGRGRTRVVLNRLTGNRTPTAALARLALAQLASGLVSQVRNRLLHRPSDFVAARLLWMRGAGTLAELLRRHR